MPALGPFRDTARLVRWLRREGDRVDRGEPLLEVESDLQIMAVQAPGAGVLSGVRFREGEEVRVGAVMAYLLAPAARPGVARPPERSSDAAPISDARPSPVWQQPSAVALAREVDASQLIVARAKQPDAVSQSDVLLRVLAAVLGRHPLMNANRSEVNLAMMIPLDEGMAMPVIHGSNRLDLPSLAGRRADLTQRARAGRLRGRDLADATFAICDLSSFGVDGCWLGVPEGLAGILSAGRVVERVVPVNGKPQVRHMLTLTLAYDAGLISSARAAAFLVELAEAVEEPADIL